MRTQILSDERDVNDSVFEDFLQMLDILVQPKCLYDPFSECSPSQISSSQECSPGKDQ